MMKGLLPMRFTVFCQRSVLGLLFICLCAALMGAGVSASVFQKGKQVVISNLHVIDDDLYAWGEDFTMEGTVNGDLTAGAMDAKIYGQVSKAVNVSGFKVLYAGRCGGAYRSFAYEQTLDGVVGGSAVALGYSIELGKGAVVEHDFWAAGLILRLDGLVKGKVWARAANIFITGHIDGDVELHGEHLTILPPAVINGNLTYFSNNPPSIDTSGVTITGTVRHERPDQSASDGKISSAQNIVFRISGLIAAFLLGAFLLRLCRSYVEASFRQVTTKFSASLAAGLVLVGLIALSFIVLAMSALAGLIGQALIASGGVGSVFGSILLVFSILALPISGFFSLTGAITFYLGRVIIALLLGALVTRQLSSEGKLPGYAVMFVGLLILSALFAIPYAGIVIYLVVATIGAGALVLGVKRCREEIRRPQAEVQ
jgi:cytoskeletal protein CcmA (bactofilin family)